jgi:uncharacterized protein
MPQIVQSINYNPAGLSLDDVYIVLVPPPSFIQGVLSTVAGIVGTASYGPKNTPVFLGNTADLVRTFGDITVASLTDTHDLPRDVKIAFAQGAQSTLGIWGVRVSDGTDAAAAFTLLDVQGSPANGIVLTAAYTGTGGNKITVLIQTGLNANSFNVTIIGPTGTQTELYPNIAGSASGASPFWGNLNSALLNGLAGYRGPSKLVVPSAASATAQNPKLGTSVLVGGTDGRSSVTSAQLLGSDAGVPKTGAYALRSLQPFASVAWIAGLTDSSIYAALQALADAEGFTLLLTQVTGVSTSAFITAKQTVGIDDPQVAWIKDWIYFYDPVNTQLYLNSPLPFAGGRIAALSPEQYPGNKGVTAVYGTERYNPQTGTVPYSNAELGQLEAAGVMVITNPIPAGGWGLRNGVNSSSNPAQNGINWTRLTQWLSISLGQSGVLGAVVGQLQSQRPNDRLRQRVRHLLNDFLNNLRRNFVIDDYKVICDLTNNTPSTISQGYLKADVLVRYLKEVRFFEIRLQGGSTVVTSTSALTSALPAA